MKNFKGFVITGIVVVLIWVLSWVLIQNYYGTGVDDGRGTFGDMFGAVNSLFAGLAFAGIIYSIIMQREDLKLQKKSIDKQTESIKLQTEELKLTQIETAKMADELEGQKKIMNMQHVENILFRMIDTIQKNLNLIQSFKDEKIIKGTGTIVQKFYNDNFDTLSYVDEVNFEGEYENFQLEIDKYINSVMYTLKIIDDAEIPIEKKQLYAEVLIINMNDVEIVFICDLFEYDLLEYDQRDSSLLEKLGFIDRSIEIKDKSF